MKVTHQISVLGREIPVRSAASAEAVQQIEVFVNQRLQEIGAALKSGDAQLVLTLALLNTAEELLRLRSALEDRPDIEQRLRSMIDRLETA